MSSFFFLFLLVIHTHITVQLQYLFAYTFIQHVRSNNAGQIFILIVIPGLFFVAGSQIYNM